MVPSKRGGIEFFLPSTVTVITSQVWGTTYFNNVVAKLNANGKRRQEHQFYTYLVCMRERTSSLGNNRRELFFFLQFIYINMCVLTEQTFIITVIIKLELKVSILIHFLFKTLLSSFHVDDF
jgi:hypothetical protein